ncbi:hypothetical protein ATKI12_5072 [Kitasatospora sp. Ki12]
MDADPGRGSVRGSRYRRAGLRREGHRGRVHGVRGPDGRADGQFAGLCRCAAAYAEPGVRRSRTTTVI